MFLKTGELKKIMKSSLKRSGLIVGNIREKYLVYADSWGLSTECFYASNKFKAAIMELIGDLPENGECYLFNINSDKEVVAQAEMGYPDPFEEWKSAKDFAVTTPVSIFAWPHEFIVFQKKSDLGYVTALRSLTTDVISDSELDSKIEHRPGRPSIKDGHVLYWKNETTIYWVHTETAGSKASDVLFPHLDGMSFFEDNWLVNEDQEDEESEENKEAAGEESLPY